MPTLVMEAMVGMDTMPKLHPTSKFKLFHVKTLYTTWT